MNIHKFLYRLSHWETWHYLAKYIPISPVWFWHCLRSGSMWFFTPSNPTLAFGGFEGEGKKEMYRQLPPFCYPKTMYLSPSLSFEQAHEIVIKNDFHYPFAVKPDVGMMGLMFRKIENISQFKHYHSVMPVEYIVQEFSTYPLEVSVFYYRFPNQCSGTITGFLKKEFLQVTGDGTSTLLELMQHYPRVSFRMDEMKMKHAHRLYEVLTKGEIFVLSHALNLSRGGKLVSLAHEKDAQLLKVFDELSIYTKHFHYGRYDIKCESVEALKEGKNFTILEYNGCGAEPHHIYGNGNNLLEAYRIVLHHWNILYKISKHNHTNGVKYWKYKQGLHFLKQARAHFKKLKKLDVETEL